MNKNKISVCYKECSTDIIKWDVAVGVEKQGEELIVRFEDGGWNPANSCFFTEEQCSKYHNLPPKIWNNELAEIADDLECLLNSVREKLGQNSNLNLLADNE